MFRKGFLALLISSFVIGSVFFLPGSVQPVSAQDSVQGIKVPTAVFPESDDFATQQLGDPWDMSSFYDVSQYFNGAGRHPSIKNQSTESGVFSGTSMFTNGEGFPAYITPLFYGYHESIQVGNLGSVHPIESSRYNCLYVAMRVESPTYVKGGPQPDQLVVNWESTRPRDGATTVTGGTFLFSYPESIPPYTAPMQHKWRLYKVNLANPQHGTYSGTVPWNDRATWEGLKLTTTLYKDTNFAVDWIRLTNCNDSPTFQAKITWTPNNNLTALWIQPVGTARNILVDSTIKGGSGSYTLDTKGLPPGKYKVGLGKLNECCSQWSDQVITVNQAPIATFANPSPASGTDYATQAGNPWDMDLTDVSRVVCGDTRYENGSLFVTTLNPQALPGECLGPELSESDSQVFMNLPAPLNTGEYRYISFRMFQNGEYSIPADGMIVRFMWTNEQHCTWTSKDIPLDVGWHTYMADMWDAYNGMPVAVNPASCGLRPWREAGRIIRLRLDPNENWTGNLVPAMVFDQGIDWIKLTKPFAVTRGQKFMVMLNVNKPQSEIDSIQYFYATPGNQLQSANWQVMDYNANESAEQPGVTPDWVMAAGTRKVFIPSLQRSFDPTFNGITYSWNTSNVPAGEYYICAKLNDGVNVSEHCSEASIIVR